VPVDDILITLTIGLVAGAVGGLAGIGGSIIMLPALALVFGYPSGEAKTEHHLYMAAAMIVNVVVAFSSGAKHKTAGGVGADLARPLLPSMVVAILGGVWLSNVFEGRVAKTGLIVFLFAFCAYTLFTTLRRLPDHEEKDRRGGPAVLVAIGLFTGVLAGFLGIGGGIVMVPLIQVLARVPLRQCIAASAAVMWASSIIGSIGKLATLHTHTINGEALLWTDAVVLAFPMAMGALVGAYYGAGLTHRLRLPFLRLAIAIVLAGAGLRMAGIV